jgi:DNA recombination protein RmuC
VDFEKHADQVRGRLRELASKDYAEKLGALGKAPEFTIMFIPGDDFLAAALTVDPELFEEGAGKNVMLASPTILLPLLRVVEVGWRQERFLKNIEQLREDAKVLYDRLAGLTDRLGSLGKRLEGAVNEYNALVASYDSRVMPQARKFEGTGAQGSKELADVQETESRPRQPKSVEG